MAVSLEVPVVRVAGGRTSDDLRALWVVWKRELIRFRRNRMRILTSLAQPVLFLFILGTGLSTVISSADHFDFRTFMFPGVLGMTVLFTSIFSAISIVWDREFGFLREMLVAPVHRWTLVLGKCLGGATVATIQGAIMLALAGLVGVPYNPVMLLVLLVEMVLTAFALTAFGVMLAARISDVQSFQVITQLFVLPMFFLSGAVFPVTRLPGWLDALSKIDPLSYAVDPLRKEVFSYLTMPPAIRSTFDPGISWGSWHLPVYFEVTLVAVAAVVMLATEIRQFSKTT